MANEAANKFQVLVVEDDELVGLTLQNQLRSLSTEVTLVSGAQSFLAKMSMPEKRYDLAVVDIGLPGLTGDHLISWLRTSTEEWVRRLPVLVVTGIPDFAKGLAEAQEPGVEVLAKPYTFTELQFAICGLRPANYAH
ncbi:MAG: response regulator [Pseudomonadota bacterium]